MARLLKATAARPLKKSELAKSATVMLKKGTSYSTVSLTCDPLGYTVQRIMVGCREYDLFS